MDNPPSYDEFLSLMTFAEGGLGCECCDGGDECGQPSASAVPPTISNAVDEHLRKRKLEEPSVFEGSKRLHIRQNRELVKREDGFTIWKLDLPAVNGGDPIVEYRNNHRILFVKQLNTKASHVLSIGQGIIGSAAEENSRKRVNWEEGSAYLMPCSKGIACGWIHKPSDDTESRKSDIPEGDSTSIPPIDAADVVIYSLKVSPETLQTMEVTNIEDTSCWVKESYSLFRQCLAKSQQTKNVANQRDESDDNGKIAIEGTPLSVKESLTMNLIIELAK